MAELRLPKINKIHIAGRVCVDPQFEDLPQGSKLRARIAVDDSFFGSGKLRVSRSSFFNFSIFGKQTENAFDMIFKGSPIYLEGTLHSFTYTAEDGIRHHGVEIRVTEFQVLEKIFHNVGDEELDDES